MPSHKNNVNSSDIQAGKVASQTVYNDLAIFVLQVRNLKT